MAEAPKGIDVRQSTGPVLARALLQTTAGGFVTSGATLVRFYELQSTGALKSFDFSTGLFSSGTLIQEYVSASYQKGNNNTTDTGIWTYAQNAVSGFTVNGIYIVRFDNVAAWPSCQEREFQYGGTEGDVITVPVSAGAANIQTILASGSFDFISIANDLGCAMFSAYLYTTNATTPTTAGTWAVNTLSNGVRVYSLSGNAQYAWNNSSNNEWVISSAVGSTSGPYWATAPDSTVVGPYTAFNGAIGTPNVVAHGNAVLASFQPDKPFPTYFGNTQINQAGFVGPDLTNINQAITPTTLNNITIPNVTSVGNVTGNIIGTVDTEPSWYTASPTAAAIVTAMLTDNPTSNPSDFATPSSLGSMVITTNESFITFTVSDTNPTTNSFIITLTNGATFPTLGFPGNFLKFTTGVLTAQTRQATSFNVTSSTIAQVTFTTGFTVAPATNSKGIIF